MRNQLKHRPPRPVNAPNKGVSVRAFVGATLAPLYPPPPPPLMSGWADKTIRPRSAPHKWMAFLLKIHFEPQQTHSHQDHLQLQLENLRTEWDV